MASIRAARSSNSIALVAWFRTLSTALTLVDAGVLGWPPLQESRWKYFVVAFDGDKTNIAELQNVFDIGKLTRGLRSHSTPDHGDTRTTTFKQIVEFPDRDKLHEDIGIVFINLLSSA
jgi:hypothetical protein